MWLGASLLMIFAATENFRTANSAVASPPGGLAELTKTAGGEPVRQILRYQASEANRRLFGAFGAAQFGAAVVVFLLILFATSAGRFPVLLALAIVILVSIMHWLITPQIATGSRVLDFVPLQEMAAERERLRSIHNIYSAMEIVKLLLVAGLGAFFLFGSQRRSRSELR